MTRREQRTLTILAFLGLLSAGWAAFLWRELLRARQGQEPFCGFGGGDCGELWNSSLASTIHGATGVPVAGWGLIWGLVAFLLPLTMRLGWWSGASKAAWLWSLWLTALAGLGSVVMLLASSLALRMLCTSCVVTYVLVLAYLAVTFLRLPTPEGSGLVRGGLAAVVAVAVCYLLVLVPGLRTPKSVGEEGARVLQQQTPTRTRTREPLAGKDAQLQALIDSLSPQLQQALADSLDAYAHAAFFPPEEPRTLEGNAAAPVLITEFTDILCSHCAALHETLASMKGLLPEGSFRIDSRHFPLDGECNPFVPVPREDHVRCRGALAQICMEDNPQAFEYSGEMFRQQRTLTEEQVVALGARYMDRATLEACMAAPATRQTLQADLEYAARYRPRGTPLVLINGREAPHFGPFLYAMILTGGEVDHPLFAALPPPRQVTDRQ